MARAKSSMVKAEAEEQLGRWFAVYCLQEANGNSARAVL